MATSLIVNKTTAAMKSNQKSIPNISDTASDYDCANFATHLIEDLSTDTVDGVYRVQRTDITDATPVTQKTTGTITLSQTTATKTEINNQLDVTITYNGDATLYAYIESSTYTGYTGYCYNSDGWYLTIQKLGNSSTTSIVVTVYAPETNNYTAATATFTITA